MIRYLVCATLHCDVCGTELTDESEGITPHARSAGEIADAARLLDWTVTDDGLTAVCDTRDDTHQAARSSGTAPQPRPAELPGQDPLPLPEPDAAKLPQPPIVTLCGSTKFWPQFAEVTLRETAAGRMVLAPGCDMKTTHPLWEDPAAAQALKEALDALHMAKIRAAASIVVVSDGSGYMGSSTHREVAYALSLGLPIRHDKVDLATGTVTSTAITLAR